MQMSLWSTAYRLVDTATRGPISFWELRRGDRVIGTMSELSYDRLSCMVIGDGGGQEDIEALWSDALSAPF